jgi:hypothetical protein
LIFLVYVIFQFWHGYKEATKNKKYDDNSEKSKSDVETLIKINKVRNSMTQYKVIAVTTGCCAADIDPKEIETRSNELGAQGYELVEAYEAITSGCCSRKKSSILIFKKP